jgi:hypothetical protein
MSEFFKANPRILVGMILGVLYGIIYQPNTNNWCFYIPEVIGIAMWGGIVAAKTENDEQAIHRMASGAFIGTIIGSFMLLLIALPINKLVGPLWAGALIGLAYRWALKGALIGMIFGFFAGTIPLLDETMRSREELRQAIEGLIGGNLAEVIAWLIGWPISAALLGATGAATLWLLIGETPSPSRRHSRREGLHHKESNLPIFASPFWPSQWLRLVWSVWVNQLWYWENVGPLLSKKRRNWTILAQASLGATLVGISLSIIIGSILDVIFLAANWPNLMIGAIAGALIPLPWIALPLKNGDVDRVPWIICFGVSGSIAVSLLSAYPGTSLITYQIGLACFFPLGLAFGVYNGVVNRVANGGCSYVICLFITSSLIFTTNKNKIFIIKSIVFNIITMIMYLLSVKIGHRWATRQVPDEKTRKRLVNPNGRM